MIRIIIVVTMALSYLKGIGQNAMIRSHSGKIETEIELIIPIDKGILYESYVYFKTVYWLEERDTVFQNVDLTYSNDRLKINNEGFESIPACDTTINKIRNSSLRHRMQNQLNDSIAFYIGRDNKEMASQKSYINTNAISQKCYSEFETDYTAWFNEQLKTIQTILDSKKQRLKQIENVQNLDDQFISMFLNDFGSCEVDFNALELVILKDVDLLLSVINRWADIEFNRFKWKLDDFHYLKSKNAVIQELENSKVPSARQKALLKLFKKINT